MKIIIQFEQAAQMLQNQTNAQRLAFETEERAAQETIKLKKIQAKNETEARELLRLREETRIREMKAKVEKERVRRE
jgi:hypothetical protein